MMYARDRSLYRAKVLLLAAAAGLFLASCDQSSGSNHGAEAVHRADIVAGPGEKNFAERYDLKLTLPMPETEFFALLRRLKLTYGVCGERGTDIDLPPLRQQTTVDLSKAQKCYEIDGEVDRVQRVGKRYRAFVDKDHRVIYIENAFSYTGP